MTTATDLHPDGPDEIEDHDRGLGFDLPTILSRRRMLSFAAGAAGLSPLAACGSDSRRRRPRPRPPRRRPPARRRRHPARRRQRRPAPRPGLLTRPSPRPARRPPTRSPRRPTGRTRPTGPTARTCSPRAASSAATSAPASGRRPPPPSGVPATISFTVLDASTGQPIEGAAVYVWHCDRDGDYSMYSQRRHRRELPAWRAADRRRRARRTFTSIYPACYSGRWPHVHFEVYPSLDAATSASELLATSQIALPDEVNKAVFATDGYEQSVRNYAQHVAGHGQRVQRRCRPGDADRHRRRDRRLRRSPCPSPSPPDGRPPGGRRLLEEAAEGGDDDHEADAGHDDAAAARRDGEVVLVLAARAAGAAAPCTLPTNSAPPSASRSQTMRSSPNRSPTHSSVPPSGGVSTLRGRRCRTWCTGRGTPAGRCRWGRRGAWR